MQQTYYCPYCGAPAAYGQPQCTNCNQPFDWQAGQSQQQYQTPGYQYPDQQQQWYQAPPDYQTQGWANQGQSIPQAVGKKQSLSQLITGWRQSIQNNRKVIILTGAGLAVVALLIVGGIILEKEGKKWFAAPTVADFSASSTNIIEGQEATLQWAAAGASSVSINPGIGTVPASGTKKVSPVKKTTYTLVAANSFGTASRSVTIDVMGKVPVISSFTINPNNIYAGQSAKLAWNVTGAASVSINPEVGSVPVTGTADVLPGSTISYVLTASNSAGNSTASVTLNVTTSKLPVITVFTASPTAIKAGEGSALTWEVLSATSINISPGIGGIAAKGSSKITPSATTTYTLTANNAYGSATRDITVTIDTSNISGTEKSTITAAPPVINSFSVNKSYITLGDNITLNWSVTGARSLSISPDIGPVTSSGWTMVIPITNTEYTLSATNTFGTTTATEDVTVTRDTEGVAPVIRSFTAIPNSISRGATSSLSWDIDRATVITISQGIGVPASKYSQNVSPTETTSYNLTAINKSGTDNRTVTITVLP